tara:strand:+ start:396 stop:1454 length:1059 start_codon:yes stop_codon:yes gene_type:complete
MSEKLKQMPNNATDRPLVTFALFAYNQEEYIREAVEGAFAQTYEPLEIILSDDCSTDRTFEIIQEMADAYDGPHSIILRRNIINLGTALHVQMAFGESRGLLFVVAAGDDISRPNRVSILVDTWTGAGRPEGAIHSGWESFRKGQIIALQPVKRYSFSDRILEGYAQSYWLPAAAPTCAYTRGVFEHFAPLLGGSIIEDLPLQLRAALIGKFVACDQTLVRLRLHDESTGTGYNIDSPSRWNRFVISKAIALRTMQRDVASWQGEMDQALRRQIERKIVAGLHSASGLLLPETRPINLGTRLMLGVRIATAPIITQSFPFRVAYALSFFKFDFHRRLYHRIRPWICWFQRVR